MFSDPLVVPSDLKKLNKDVNVKEALKYVYDAITLTRHTLEGKIPLIGFSGAPVSRIILTLIHIYLLLVLKVDINELYGRRRRFKYTVKS